MRKVKRVIFVAGFRVLVVWELDGCSMMRTLLYSSFPFPSHSVILSSSLHLDGPLRERAHLLLSLSFYRSRYIEPLSLFNVPHCPALPALLLLLLLTSYKHSSNLSSFLSRRGSICSYSGSSARVSHQKQQSCLPPEAHVQNLPKKPYKIMSRRKQSCPQHLATSKVQPLLVQESGISEGKFSSIS